MSSKTVCDQTFLYCLPPEQRLSEPVQHPGQHGPARGCERGPPGPGGAVTAGWSLGPHEEQETEDSTGLCCGDQGKSENLTATEGLDQGQGDFVKQSCTKMYSMCNFIFLRFANFLFVSTSPTVLCMGLHVILFSSRSEPTTIELGEIMSSL